MFSWYESQTRPSPLAFRGETLIHSRGHELWTIDSMTMTPIDGYVIPHEHFCVVQDGTISVFSVDSHDCVLHRIDANGAREMLPGPMFFSSDRYQTLVVAAGAPDDVYVTDDKEIIWFRRLNNGIESIAKMPLPSPNNSRGQLFSLGDGRLVGSGDGLHVLEPGKPVITSPMPKRYPLHLVRATGDRLWYSHATTGFNAADVLVLATLTNPMLEEQRILFAPARIVHLASSGRAVAALLFAFSGDTLPELVLEWSVVVTGEDGTERWRADVPSSFTPTFLDLNRVGFIAMSEHRVVLRGENAELLAWDAATGAPIV